MCHVCLIIDLIEAHAVFRLGCRHSTHSLCNACIIRESAIYIGLLLPPPFFSSYIHIILLNT